MNYSCTFPLNGERGVAKLSETMERQPEAKEGGEGEGEGVKGRLVGERKAARLRETMEKRPGAKETEWRNFKK